RLNIRSTFSRNRIPFEWYIRRRENTRLSVMKTQALHIRKIADAAGDRHVDMIFDATRLSAITDAQIRIPFVRTERHKHNLRAPLNRDARNLRELNVIANLNRDPSAIRIEHFYLIARLNAPRCPLRRSNMQLVLLPQRAIAPEQICDVVQDAVFD